MIDPNAPAFPSEEEQSRESALQQGREPVKIHFSGLTIRAELAKAAMLGMLSHNGQLPLKDLIFQSVQYADALIAELNREGEK